MNSGSDEASLVASVAAREPELVSLLSRLVSFRTESQSSECVHFPDEADRAIQFVAEWLTPLGFEIQTWDVGPSATFPRHPVLVACRDTNRDGRSLVFNAHIDVVPAAPEASWAHPPFAGVAGGGRVWGRGTSDMKAGLAAALIGVRVVLEAEGDDLGGSISFHVVTDEEIVGNGTRDIIARTPVPDAVVSMEPTDMALCATEPGLVHFRVEVEGQASHASNRYLSIYPGGNGGGGVNAIEKAMFLAEALQRLERRWGSEKAHPSYPPGYSTLTPGVIVGGPGGGSEGRLNLSPNPGTCPDYCALEYNLWYYPSQDLDDVRGEIESYVEEVCRTDPWLDSHPPKFSWKLRNIYFPPFEVPAGNESIAAMEKTLAALGLAADVKVFRGGSDLAWYSPSVGGFVLGPGRIECAHSVDEYVTNEHLLAAAKAYAVFTSRWCR